MLPLLVLLVAAPASPSLQGTSHRPQPERCPTATDSARRGGGAGGGGGDRLQPDLMPVLWSNDYGGATIGLRAQPACRDFIASTATRGTATSSVSLYARWNNPLPGLSARVATSVAAWSVEGRTGAALSLARSHLGLDLLWMATTNLGYLDRRLWDNAGSIALNPWIFTTARKGETAWRAGFGLASGMVYQELPPTGAPGSRYHYHGFIRLSGETSVRTPVGRRGTFGARVFGGAYVGPSRPVRQLRIPIAGADPYETFTNPFLRSQGALLVRPGFHYHAPGGPNLRGFRNDLGGRWAVGVNLELTRAIARRDAGPVREVALEAFLDLGLADTVAVPSLPPGRWYTTLYDGGVGIVTRQRVRELAWTMRFEVPLAVNRWNLAADYPQNSTRFALRWQVSFAPSF